MQKLREKGDFKKELSNEGSCYDCAKSIVATEFFQNSSKTFLATT